MTGKSDYSTFYLGVSDDSPKKMSITKNKKYFFPLWLLLACSAHAKGYCPGLDKAAQGTVSNKTLMIILIPCLERDGSILFCARQEMPDEGYLYHSMSISL